jgi:SAM-dependent methyltransferase
MKTKTNIHWDKRAVSIKKEMAVNIPDIHQRGLENSIICSYLRKSMRVLEVGCGNGYSTDVFRGLVQYIDAFDFSENMIKRARRVFGETNNRFIVDDVLKPKHLSGDYDLIICVRVLINLRNPREQKKALYNLSRLVRKKGLFILVEGFKDGFLALNKIRQKAGMPPVEPARINFYTFVDDLKLLLEQNFNIKEDFHLGSYDFLTRFVYPCLVGPGAVKHDSEFHEKFQQLAGAYNPDSLKQFSRIRGFVMQKK